MLLYYKFTIPTSQESSTAKKKPIIRTGGVLPAQAPLPTKETRMTKKSDLPHVRFFIVIFLWTVCINVTTRVQPTQIRLFLLIVDLSSGKYS
jgi:hypothetical protein